MYCTFKNSVFTTYLTRITSSLRGTVAKFNLRNENNLKSFRFSNENIINVRQKSQSYTIYLDQENIHIYKPNVNLSIYLSIQN